MRLFLALLAALLAGAVAGCDFTPTLDIPLPEFAPALAINGVLAADSTVEVRITTTADPYLRAPVRGGFGVPEGATAELFRDGAPLGALRLASARCDDRSVPAHPTEGPATYECGAFVSDALVEPGATYTVRASAPGYPTAEATVTVPGRLAVHVEAGPPTEQPVPGYTRVDRDLRVTVRDPAGLGDRYALLAVSGPFSRTHTDRGICVDPQCTETRDTTYTVRYDREPITYTTADPVLLAAARTIPSNGTTFITFTDEPFDGEQRTFPIRTRVLHSGADRERDVAAVWVVALDADTFGAYQVAWFGHPTGDDVNPFQEPINLPSNVTNGYGVLGAVTITEAPVE